MKTPGILLTAVVLLEIGLGISPSADRFTWLLENLPVFILAPILVALHLRRPLTPLLCWLLAIHAAILCVGGHWTYAEVPAGNWVRDAFHLARNPYDRLGHLAQGFIPVLLMREFALRSGTLRRGLMATVLLFLAAMGISALYELAEWQAVVWTGSSADAFLGTQGDIWDSQWDMACCGIGAALSLAFLGRWHDRQLAAASQP